MPIDMHGHNLSVGDVVQMDSALTNHDIVKDRAYEVMTAYGSSLTLRDCVTGNKFNDRRADAFFLVSGPW